MGKNERKKKMSSTASLTAIQPRKSAKKGKGGSLEHNGYYMHSKSALSRIAALLRKSAMSRAV